MGKDVLRLKFTEIHQIMLVGLMGDAYNDVSIKEQVPVGLPWVNSKEFKFSRFYWFLQSR